MQKNKLFLFFAFFLLVSCSRDERSLWHQKFQMKASRIPAQVTGDERPRCFIDRFNEKLIQEEINQMEVSAGINPRGSFKTKEFTYADLTMASVTALARDTYIDKAVMPFWVKNDIKSKDCKDLSCIVNGLYEKPSNEGLLHYWYFLKTGYLMSATNAFPWVNDDNTRETKQVPNTPMEAYLFSSAEWKAWWYQANLLPKSMIKMPALQSIHRVPRGYTPPSWIKGPSSQICGWAYGSYLNGIILLGDRCLTLNSAKKSIGADDQYFYHATTHEMGHRLSAWNFNLNHSQINDLDMDPAFLSLSGWKEEMLHQENGTTIHQWTVKEPVSGEWVSAYARTTPAEDFAESVGEFRTGPDFMAKKAPKKYEFIKKRVFDGKGYSEEDLRNQYVSNLKKGLMDSATDWVSACVQNKVTGPSLSAGQKQLAEKMTLSLPLSDDMRSCFSEQMVLNLEQGLRELRFQEPEACRVLDQSESDVISNTLALALPELSQYLNKDRRLNEVLLGVQAFRSAMDREFDGRGAYLSCTQMPSISDCYQVKLESEYVRLFEKYKNLITSNLLNIGEIERVRFLSTYSFTETQAQVIQFYQGLMASVLKNSDDWAKPVWDRCQNETISSNGLEGVLSPYSGGSNFIVPSVMNCLNRETLVAEQGMRAQVLQQENLSFFTPEASKWIDQQILFPYFKLEFDRRVQEGALRENGMIESLKLVAIDNTFQTMSQNSDWTQDSSGYNAQDCKLSAKAKIGIQIKEGSYRFVDTTPLVNEMSSQVCEKIRQFRQTIKAGNLSLDPIWSFFEKQMIIESSVRYDHCRSRKYIGRVLKHYCLFTELVTSTESGRLVSAWAEVRNRSTKKCLQLNEVKNFMLSNKLKATELYEAAITRMDQNRQDLVDQIYSDFTQQK